MWVRRKTIAAAVIGGGAFGAIVCLAFASQTGCQLRETCDPSNAWFPGPPAKDSYNASTVSLPTSGAIDEKTWQSNDLDSPWLYFPGGRTYAIAPHVTNSADSPVFFGPDWEFELFVGTDPQPTTTGNFVSASGNIAEVFLVTDPAPLPDGGGTSSFFVVNATCADYYLRILIRRYPPDAGVTSILDAAASDAPGADDASDAGAD